MHMGSGFCSCAGLAAAEGLRFAAVGGGVPNAPRAVKTAPYDAKDKRAAMAGLRAGHARPLQGIHGSHALASACATFSTSSSFRAEYPATTVSAWQSSGRAR